MQTLKAQLTADLTAALATAPVLADDRQARLTLTYASLQLRLIPDEESIRAALDRVKGWRQKSDRIRSVGTVEKLDYADAALDIYGNAATAAEKLQAQLDRADELEIEEKTRWRLSGLIADLRERAEATSDPTKQRSAVVRKVIEQAREESVEKERQDRIADCMAAAKAHARWAELEQAVVESGASGYYVPGLPESPLTYFPFAGHRAKRIRTIQREIAKMLRIHPIKRGYAKKVLCFDPSTYYPMAFAA